MNKVELIIKENDYASLEKMAACYNMQLDKFLEFVRSQIRYKTYTLYLSPEEKELLDKKVKDKKLKRSEYVAIKIQEFLDTNENELYDKFQLFNMDMTRSGGRKGISLTLYDKLYNEIKEKSHLLNVDMAVLIRYLALR